MAELIGASGLFGKIYTAQLENERGLSAKKLKLLFGGLNVIVKEDIPGALTKMLELREDEDRIYVAGSLYLVGEVKAAWGSRMKGM